ncbi:hypothetical protein KP509_27G061700 [Ceratopteris richardii]|uniref:Major facilitator superfamily (MFS) profile domain-containing protein n=1 Tax=Ceratopteris richardii TaxID=49495 RepID=A0A8T2RH24_CERRI|nr:hypothetical protein KP509_27G061700 [Ceratopteris richardii]
MVDSYLDIMYKRLPSRDYRSDDPGFASLSISLDPLIEVPIASPPWHLSFPHVSVALLAAVLFGYHMGVVNAPLQAISEDLGFSGNALAQGWVVSTCLFGAFFGCATSGSIADTFGRRRAFQLSTVPMLLGACISASASNLNSMILGRLLVGVGLGISGPVTALYVTEISPTAVRGTFGSLAQIANCIGILGALVMGLPVATIPGWWRKCFWIATMPAALLAIGMEFCSESPRWLFKSSRLADAEHEIERLWGAAYVKCALSELIRGEKHEEDEPATFADLLSDRYRKVVIIGAALFAFQQLAGINAVFYFSSTVFRSAGITSDLVASVSVGVVNLLASIIAACLMDSQGRRNLLIWSFTGMFIALAVQAIVGSISALSSLQKTVSLSGTLMYVLSFALGVGPVPALLLPEIFPNRIRAKAMAVSMCVHWVANCFVGLMFLHLLERFGAPSLYSFFALVCCMAVLFVRRNVMETKGKSLEEIEAALLPEK